MIERKYVLFQDVSLLHEVAGHTKNNVTFVIMGSTRRTKAMKNQLSLPLKTKTNIKQTRTLKPKLF